MNDTKPCLEQSKAIQSVYDFLNAGLWIRPLPRPMLIWSRNSRIIGGYFSPDKWTDETGNKTDEIALNANLMSKGDLLFLYGILAHEMCHVWQQHFGKPSRAGYHNQELANEFKRIGLLPRSPDGKETGQAIETTIIPGGLFEELISTMPEEYNLPFMAEELDPEPPQNGKQNDPNAPIPKPKSRINFTCPICGLNAKARPGSCLHCSSGGHPLQEMTQETT